VETPHEKTHNIGTPLWYALMMRSRFEMKSQGILTDKGIETFLPLIEEVHIWSDRKKLVKEPLFRGYLFVKTDLKRKVEILETSGVVKFVEFSGKPVFIPEYQIEWVRRATAEPRKVQRENYLEAGDRVRVTSGPLTGLEGFVVQARGHARLVISVSTIAQSFSIEISEDSLVRVDDQGKQRSVR
jgi:transcription antitermination factor NusG